MLEDFAQIMFIIMAFMIIGATILFITLNIIIFRKISHAVDSVKGVVDEVKGVTSFVSNSILRPTAKGVGVFSGVRKVVSFLGQLKQNKGGNSGETK